MRKIIPFLTVLLSSLLLMTACASRDGFIGGRPITKEELASISAELFSTAAEPEDSVGEEISPADTAAAASDPNQTVYWLKNSSVYHTDAQCGHLDGQRTVKESTRRTAEINGLRPCKDCVKE